MFKFNKSTAVTRVKSCLKLVFRFLQIEIKDIAQQPDNNNSNRLYRFFFTQPLILHCLFVDKRVSCHVVCALQ